MKAAILLVLCLIPAAAFSQEVAAKPSPAAETPPAPELTVRSKALDLAGAFSNDGYRIRDGFWSGEIEPGKPRVLEVNLFAGNEYWFCAAGGPAARRIAVSVFDEKGQPVEFLDYSDGATAAAGVEPELSGRYFICVDLLEGEKSEFCLLYTYK